MDFSVAKPRTQPRNHLRAAAPVPDPTSRWRCWARLLDLAQLLGLDKPARITVLYLLCIAPTLRIATSMEDWNGPFGLNSTVSVPA